MSFVHAQCPACGATFQLAAAAAGRAVRCTACGQSFTAGAAVPSPAAAAVNTGFGSVPLFSRGWLRVYGVVGSLAVLALATRLVPGMVGVWAGAIAVLLAILIAVAVFGYFFFFAYLVDLHLADAREVWKRRWRPAIHGTILLFVATPVVSLTQLGRDPKGGGGGGADDRPTARADRAASATPPGNRPKEPSPAAAAAERRPAAPPVPKVIPSNPVPRGPVTTAPSAAARPAAVSPAPAPPRPAPAPATRPPAVAAPPASDGQWRSALAGLDPARDAPAGTWSLPAGGSALAVAAAAPGAGVRKVVLPAVPPAVDYQLRVRFVRTAGAKEWCLLLPIGGRAAQVWVGGGSGQSSSLAPFTNSRVDPAAAPLVNGVEQELVFNVRGAADGGESSVDATLDGKPYLAWRGDKARLTVDRRYALPDPSRLGLAVHEASAVEFREVSVR